METIEQTNELVENVQKESWLRLKMTTSFNKQTFAELQKFVDNLPENSGIDSITKLVVHLVRNAEKTAVSTQTNNEDVQRVEAQNHVLQQANDSLQKQLSESKHTLEQVEKQFAELQKVNRAYHAVAIEDAKTIKKKDEVINHWMFSK